MDIRQLKLVLTVADAGSFNAAAEQLYISRPAVSKAVAQIEDETGFPLFERSSSGVTLTEAGQQLLPRMRGIMNEFGSLETDIQAMRSSRQRIKIGFAYGTYLIFMDALQNFVDEHPDIVLDISHYQYEDIVPALKNGSLDLACSGYVFNDADLVRRPAYRCEAVWGVRSDSPMAKRGYITDEEIHSFPHCIPSGSRAMKSDISLSAITDKKGENDYAQTDLSYQYILNDNMFFLCKLVLLGKAIMPIGREALPVSVEGITFVTCPEHEYFWEADIYYCARRKLRKVVITLMDEVFSGLDRTGK
jgi:DNA-binding transcriptional LysR family regulator